MSDQLWGVFFGALVASIVPLLTLRINQTQWRIEKRLDILRRRRDELEKIYAEILETLPEALAESSHPIRMMSKISVHASKDVKKLYYDYMDSPERDQASIKLLMLELSVAAERHMLSVDEEIERLLR